MYLSFSSTSAMLGVSRGSDYSAANGHLEALARCRTAQGLLGTSILLGGVADVGLAADQCTAAGHGMSASTFASLIHRYLSTGSSNIPVVASNDNWAVMANAAGNLFPLLRDCVAEVSSENSTRTPHVVTSHTVIAHGNCNSIIRSMVFELIDTQSLDVDTPLMESGLESLTAVVFRNRLISALGGRTMPATLVFDFPTISEISSYLTSSETAPAAATRTPPTETHPGFACRDTSSCSSHLNVYGVAATFPASNSPANPVRCLMRTGVDAVTKIPFARWDNNDYFDPEPAKQGKYYTNHASLIEGLHLFDHRLFGIAPYEASGMDPQQRCILTVGYQAL